MRKPLQILGPTIKEQSVFVSAQDTVNLWPRLTKPGAKSAIVLYPPPGLTPFAVAGSGPNRSNGVVFGDYAYFVNGTNLYRITTAGGATNVGTLATSSGRASIILGRTYILILDGTSGYYYDGTTFTTITDVDFPAGASQGSHLDGYFIVLKPATDEFYLSAPNDPSSWNALDFEAASAKPDNAVAIFSTTKDLAIAGDRSIQFYYNSGNSDFPFIPYSGGVLEFGVKAPASVFNSSVGTFLLATADEGGIAVVLINGFQAQIISDDIGPELASLTTVTDAEGFVYRKDDRTYYQISFPSEAKTYEYLVEGGFWVTRKSNGITRYRGNGHVFLGNKNIVGDYENGKYYTLDFTTYTDNLLTLERSRTTQQIHADGNQITFHELILEMEVGVGLVSGQGSNPLVTMNYSDDNGKSWSANLTGSMGLIGDYNIIIQWNKLGASYNRIFKFTVTDPVKVVFINCYAMVGVTL